jgi:hypothetical protein
MSRTRKEPAIATFAGNRSIKRLFEEKHEVLTTPFSSRMNVEYLARGFDVVATDPAPNAEESLRTYVDESWEELMALGLAPGASRNRLSFTVNMKEALANADFVQENAPERPEFKINKSRAQQGKAFVEEIHA